MDAFSWVFGDNIVSIRSWHCELSFLLNVDFSLYFPDITLYFEMKKHINMLTYFQCWIIWHETFMIKDFEKTFILKILENGKEHILDMISTYKW